MDPYTFINSGFLTFTRAFVATRVNAAGLIETVPADTMRLDHDPVTLAQKGLLIEEAKTNSVRESNELKNAAWSKFRTTATSSSDFPIFASEHVFLLTGNGASGTKAASCNFTQFTTHFTMSIFMRRSTNNFVQLETFNDTTIWANFNLPSNGSNRQCIGKFNSHSDTLAGRMI